MYISHLVKYSQLHVKVLSLSNLAEVDLWIDILLDIVNSVYYFLIAVGHRNDLLQLFIKSFALLRYCQCKHLI